MSWWDAAACRGSTGINWFPHGDDGRNMKRAREVCAGCPVSAECLADALEHHDFGIWAGTSQRERDRILRRRRPVPQAERGHSPVAACGTDSGYARHLRVTRTEPCQACRDAHATANALSDRLRRQAAS